MTATDDPLVSTDWLAARIDDPKVKVIDASFKLPGVLPLPLDDYLGCAYSRRGVLRCRCHFRSRRPAAAYVSGCRAVRPRRLPRSAFPRRYGGGLRFRRLGRRAAGVVDVPVVRPSRCEGARRRLEEMAARGTPDAFRQRHADAWKIPGQIRFQFRPQPAASGPQSENACRTSGRCAPARAFRRDRRRTAAGSALRSHPGQPQRALCRIVRRHVPAR